MGETADITALPQYGNGPLGRGPGHLLLPGIDRLEVGTMPASS
jgi:hypothetical protein